MEYAIRRQLRRYPTPTVRQIRRFRSTIISILYNEKGNGLPHWDDGVPLFHSYFFCLSFSSFFSHHHHYIGSILTFELHLQRVGFGFGWLLLVTSFDWFCSVPAASMCFLSTAASHAPSWGFPKESCFSAPLYRLSRFPVIHFQGGVLFRFLISPASRRCFVFFLC